MTPPELALISFGTGFLAGTFRIWRPESWLIEWRDEETVRSEEITSQNWVPHSFEPLSMIRLTVGWGPWRRKRTAIRKVTSWKIERRYGGDQLNMRDWKGDYTEIYWEDTGAPLSRFAARRVERLRKENHENMNRRNEAADLEQKSLQRLLSPPE